MNKVAIKVRGLSKKYALQKEENASFRSFFKNMGRKKRSKESFWALKDISFDLNQGEVLGIIGPNGAGKSSLLKILSGIIMPTKGEAVITGKVSSLIEIGTGFHPDLTGRENVFLNGTFLGMTRKEITKNLPAIIEFSGIDEFIDTPVKNYSSGMYLRLAFSVAAFLDSDILLIDEIIAVGDLEFQRNCFEKIEEAYQSGKTILLVSHDLSYIKKLCDRCILIDHGKIVKTGLTDDVLSYYVNAVEKQKKLDTIHVEGLGNLAQLFFLNKNGEKKYSLFGGEAYSLHLGFEIKIEQREEIQCRIFIKNNFGNIVLTLSNIFSGEKIVLDKNINQIHCDIPKFPLNIGKYWVDLHLKLATGNWLKFQHVMNFEVKKGAFYKTGMQPKHGQLMEYEWKTN